MDEFLYMTMKRCELLKIVWRTAAVLNPATIELTCSKQQPALNPCVQSGMWLFAVILKGNQLTDS